MNADGLLEAVRRLGLIGTGEGAELAPLSGGVSSDVFLVRAADGREFVVKRSIPRLRVKADWRAPVTRDTAEIAWLEAVRAVDPRLAPEVLARDPASHLFVMNRMAGDPWKAEMASGRVDPSFAALVGAGLARIHAATAGRADLAAQFPDGGNFAALRIDPFILYTADRHADVAGRLRALAADLGSRRDVLIWGDCSPKNILVGPAGPVFLDAETATMGDAAFDLAFCLTHLLLKTVWLPHLDQRLLTSFETLRASYAAAVGAAPEFETRSAALVGALLLARVDGKSPAGYLDAAQDAVVRGRAKSILLRPGLALTDLPTFWRSFA
jgi:aminoglycoside phosphotransferase (APT) family kinase protein